MINIQFSGDTVCLHVHEGRPFIAVNPLCDNMGIDALSQVRRLERHAANGRLDTATITMADKTYLAIPLEELSWFLRTLRPQSSDVQERLALYRAHLTWALLWHWFQFAREYSPAKDFTGRMQSAIPAARAAPPIPKAKISLEDVDEMRLLKSQGIPQAEIARRLKCSPATVCQCLQGKYPVKIKSRQDQAA